MHLQGLSTHSILHNCPQARAAASSTHSRTFSFVVPPAFCP